jgi:hypothetical protein
MTFTDENGASPLSKLAVSSAGAEKGLHLIGKYYEPRE